jgi:acyl-CoA reductase-like NAD-dependent aldehyde dehydrogenase
MQTKLLINGKLVAGGGEVEQVDSEMPHGGLKRSGYGKDLSMYALEDYTVVRHVMAKL